MKTITIHRTQTWDQGTFGNVIINRQVLFTGELPWRDNVKDFSCIPAGIYEASIVWSPKFRKLLYLLKDVPGRSEVRIHNGNYCGDKIKGYKSHVEGCIILGLRNEVLRDQLAVTNSKIALENFMAYTDGEDLQIKIIEDYGKA